VQVEEFRGGFAVLEAIGRRQPHA